LNGATADYATVGGGRSNDATASYATVGGGEGNVASGSHATVGGGHYNRVVTGTYATIAGGGPSDPDNPTTTNNRVYDNYGTIGGGGYNRAGSDDGNPTSARYATVGGGGGNYANASYATVGGGGGNYANASYATVGGGGANVASATLATVGGGRYNEASGYAATVPGGYDNTASGDYSFAAGRRARANHNGSFVLADSTDADFTSVRENALRVRFNGGATFVVNDGYWVRFWSTGGHLIDTSTGAHLTTGGVWTNASDRDAKENFAPVDGQEVLARLAQVPIQTWNYKAEDPSVRHLGPTAQDFYAAFGLGEDEFHISTADADGVALAAIQALYERSLALEAENAALRGRLDDLEARVAALEQAVGASRSPQSNLSGGWPFDNMTGEPVKSQGWWLVGGLLVVAVAVGQRRFLGGGR
jgi:hypothetical protein